MHYHHTKSNTMAITRDTALTLATPPSSIDKTLWLFELCRFLVGQCNRLIVGFLFDTPPCSAATCPEMRASEWQFLCAVHDAPKSCCAIDYCCHTLDWAANVVTNPKIFPSRFVVDPHDRQTAIKNLINVFRRLHRIFAHAWFQHRGVFWSVEGMSGLYVFFKTVCDSYDLLPAENYKLPPEAEGLESAAVDSDVIEKKTLLSRDPQQQLQQQQLPSAAAPRLSSHRGTADHGLGDDDNLAPTSRTNTRRHIKSSPSTGSAVTTVPEADEDEAAEVTSRLRGMYISNNPTAVPVDEEMELATIPVIVEHIPVDQPPQRPGTVVPLAERTDLARGLVFDAGPIPEVESPAAGPVLLEVEPQCHYEPTVEGGSEKQAEPGTSEAGAIQNFELAEAVSTAPEPVVETTAAEPGPNPEPEPESQPQSQSAAWGQGLGDLGAVKPPAQSQITEESLADETEPKTNSEPPKTNKDAETNEATTSSASQGPVENTGTAESTSDTSSVGISIPTPPASDGEVGTDEETDKIEDAPAPAEKEKESSDEKATPLAEEKPKPEVDEKAK